MRLAVALPNLPSRTLQRRALDDVLAWLARMDTEIELFAESCGGQPEDGYPTHHYLRLPQRHLEAPFDVALYPLGGDSPVYESVLVCMAQLAGLVWVLDPVLHHLTVGGIALRERWQDYQAMMADAFPDSGHALAEVVAAGWATNAFYRSYDPSAVLLADQTAVLAASPSLRAGLQALLGESSVECVELPLPPQRRSGLDLRDPAASAGIVSSDPEQRRCRLFVLSISSASPKPALLGLARLLQKNPHVEISVCVPEPVYHVEGCASCRERRYPSANSLGVIAGLERTRSRGERL